MPHSGGMGEHMSAKILAIGDVAGSPGMNILAKKLRQTIRQYGVSFTVVNGENAAVMGMTPANAESLFEYGADVITLGNHTWDRREIVSYIEEARYVLRPANYAPQNPGRGWGTFDTPFGDICVINLIGRCHMDFGTENPFFEADRILKQSSAKITLVDFHAEATSEKQALGFYLDGRVTAVWGTHTRVQTSDEIGRAHV